MSNTYINRTELRNMNVVNKLITARGGDLISLRRLGSVVRYHAVYVQDDALWWATVNTIEQRIYDVEKRCSARDHDFKLSATIIESERQRGLESC